MTATERRNVAGRERQVFVVRAKSEIYANTTTAFPGYLARPASLDPPPYRNDQTWWYDPVDGIVAGAKLVWKNFSHTGWGHEYRLVKATFPGVLAIAKATLPPKPPVTKSAPPVAKPTRRAATATENRLGVAVIIGNKTYSDQIPAVELAHNDAAAMKAYVANVLGFREGNIIDLRDASKAQLEATFGNKETHKGQLFNWVRTGKSDVVVFYSGHGVPGLKDRRGYLLPSDGRANFAELTGYPLDTLLGNLEKIPAKSMTVIMDACFSGNTPKGFVAKEFSGISVTPRMAKNRSITLLTAARGDQVASWDTKAKHGLFTSYLLKALHGEADSKDYGNGDGKVTLGEVRNYLDDEMTYQARRRYNRDQNPTIEGPPDQVLATYAPDELQTK